MDIFDQIAEDTTKKSPLTGGDIFDEITAPSPEIADIPRMAAKGAGETARTVGLLSSFFDPTALATKGAEVVGALTGNEELEEAGRFMYGHTASGKALREGKEAADHPRGADDLTASNYTR